jgi:hypothetical protein
VSRRQSSDVIVQTSVDQHASSLLTTRVWKSDSHVPAPRGRRSARCNESCAFHQCELDHVNVVEDRVGLNACASGGGDGGGDGVCVCVCGGG